MTLMIVLGIVACLAIALLLKNIFWSGPFPPDRGWSPRQLRRMKAGRSPWWF